jgi:hypothetical protein
MCFCSTFIQSHGKPLLKLKTIKLVKDLQILCHFPEIGHATVKLFCDTKIANTKINKKFIDDDY